uniref:DNA polymerase epsilon subunit n=1 Tax=Moniliophthora roreri TaxID=221103 RepID=A0A0W0FJU1_MONRR
MSDPRQRIIIKVFRKYSNSLGPDALEFLEEIIERHEIGDEEVETAMEAIAKEYNKQDGAYASMKVTVELLRRVYDHLQDDNEGANGGNEIIDPESHLYVVNSFDMPAWHWSVERGTFEKAPGPSTISGSAESRVNAVRDRLHVIKQCVLRNEHFAPSTVPSRDRDRLVTLKSTKQLLGRAGERFLLLGMLSRSKEGKLCLEDADDIVALDFSKFDEPSEGLYTEGCFALVEGEYTEEGTLEVIAIGQPPCESRQTARSIYGHIDFLGKGSTSLLEDAQFSVRIREHLSDLHFFFLSDVWLDDPRTLPGLKKMFDNCIENDFIPKILVMCGNFTRWSIANGTGRDIQRYQENFDALADLVSSYPIITRSCHFVFVPGPLDITMNSTLPQRPLLSSFVSRLKAKLPKSHFPSNPCRIKFFDQEIIVFRDDCMSKMMRNIAGVKVDADSDDLKRYLVQTILDQAHLSPLANNIQPTLSDFDHSLRLYPLPTALCLADKYDRFKITYTGCHVFNPGSFVGNSFNFSAYKPSEINSEECELEVDNAE